MDLQTQEKISKLMREQSAKLSVALRALKTIKLMPMLDGDKTKAASEVASRALKEISEYGKNPEDL